MASVIKHYEKRGSSENVKGTATFTDPQTKKEEATRGAHDFFPLGPESSAFN